MVAWRTAHRADGPFCREHALAAAKANLGRTLVTGWWGVESFFLNFKAIATDVAAMRSARGLPPAESASSQMPGDGRGSGPVNLLSIASRHTASGGGGLFPIPAKMASPFSSLVSTPYGRGERVSDYCGSEITIAR